MVPSGQISKSREWSSEALLSTESSSRYSLDWMKFRRRGFTSRVGGARAWSKIMSRVKFHVPSHQPTWNLTERSWKTIFLFKGPPVRFHVNWWGGTQRETKRSHGQVCLAFLFWVCDSLRRSLASRARTPYRWHRFKKPCSQWLVRGNGETEKPWRRDGCTL